MTVTAGTCTCGQQFGSVFCEIWHDHRKSQMAPVEVLPHEHVWLRPVGGIMYCGVPTCDTIARTEHR